MLGRLGGGGGQSVATALPLPAAQLPTLRHTHNPLTTVSDLTSGISGLLVRYRGGRQNPDCGPRGQRQRGTARAEHVGAHHAAAAGGGLPAGQPQVGEGSAAACSMQLDAAMLQTAAGCRCASGSLPCAAHCRRSIRRRSCQPRCLSNLNTRLPRSTYPPPFVFPSPRHPQVIRFLGICRDPPCIITEFCARGSLCDLLASARSDPEVAAQLTWRRRLAMAADAAAGMLYLHSRSSPAPIIHRGALRQGRMAGGWRHEAMHAAAGQRGAPLLLPCTLLTANGCVLV